MENYGTVHNPARARQLILFDGVSSDGFGMTDVDGLMEFRDKAIIIFEVKSVGAAVPKGQRIALERLTKDCYKAGKMAIAAVLEHTVFDTSKPVRVRDYKVREIYWGKENCWRVPHRPVKAGELVDIIIDIAKRL